MFIAILFITAKTWKHSRYTFNSLMDKLVNPQNGVLLSNKNILANQTTKINGGTLMAYC